jgi:glycosyltransferase involved in cell wall biosynthesis
VRVLILHNRYHDPGGEDAAAHREAAMLRDHGVEVIEHQVDNEAGSGKLALLAQSAWSRGSYRSVGALCKEFRPDVVHVHNFWMRLSPSVHAAAHAAGAATVQTLHNYRLICANALLLRNGQICEDCIGSLPWRGVARRCYKNSWVASAAVVRMTMHNQRRDTWNRDVDAFITPSESARNKLLHADLPADRVFVKPNFTEDPGASGLPPSASKRVVFAGRLSREKGVHLLIAAWERITCDGAQLIIAGDGPERAALEQQAAAIDSVVFLGNLTPSRVTELIKQCRCVVLPSICLETFGSTIVEAFACGRPAVVSDLGSPSELVSDGWNGLKFPQSDCALLARALEAILTDPVMADELGRNARTNYLTRFTPQANFRKLSEIYDFAIERVGVSCTA